MRVLRFDRCWVVGRWGWEMGDGGRRVRAGAGKGREEGKEKEELNKIERKER